MIAALLLAIAGDIPPEEPGFRVGEVLTHNISVCVKREDAIEIAKVDAEKGFDAAGAMWMEKDLCATVPVAGPSVGKVVFTAQVKREGRAATLSVVEILVGGEPQGYFLTTQPVHKASSFKKERDA